MTNKESKSLKYVKMDQITHVLKRPDTYIGTTNKNTMPMYVCKDKDLNSFDIVNREVTYSPGFIKIFDEILVNASDHAIRTNTVKYIKINITDEYISIENDGDGIPIEIHPIENVYVPELIFCNFLTSENYDDSVDRTVGGKNGLGAALTATYSTKFIIECCDGSKKYKQIVTDNLRNINKPSVKNAENSKSYTKITFYPDFEKFHMKTMEQESIDIMFKRCIDIAAYNPSTKVYINNKLIPIKTTKDYIKMHFNNTNDFFYEELENGWKIGVAKSMGVTFEHSSLCNGIATFKGGTHVSHVANQLAKDITEKFPKKIKIDWKSVKEKLFVFVIAAIPNPDFDTQTKENMTKYLTVDIHKNSYVSDNTVKKIMKSDIVKSILDEIEVKEKLALKRIQDKTKKVKIKKLIDAKGKDRKECSLFIFEGDSAGDAAINYIDNQTQGVFKLRGKFDNIRKMSDKKILESENTLNMMNAIGLRLNHDVKDDELRYGKLIINTDMDSDGDAIFSLMLNFFSKWKKLYEKNMIYRCLTPLLVIKKAKQKKYFYTNKEWIEYQEKNSLHGWDIEYKKGLGSLEDEEYEDMIRNPRLILVNWDETADDKLDTWFCDDTDKRKKELL